MPNPDTRRYDLGWLRIIAFGLLIVAIRFATDKATSLGQFARSRLARLGLPVLFGVYVWVMPQAYYQVRQSGEFAGSIVAFYPDYVKLEQAFSMITPTWNHLWYLVYVLAYILITLPLLPWLRRIPQSRFWQALISRPVAVVAVTILPFVVVETWLVPVYPTTHAFFGDWANHAHRFMIFLIGFFVAKDPVFWRSIDKVWKIAPALAVATWLLLGNAPSVAQWLGQFLSGTAVRFVLSYVGIMYAWSCMLLLLGFGQRFLNRESRALRYLTSAIFCYYVLHQTIIVVAGYYLTGMELGALPEFLVLTAITVAGCAVGYETLRRIPGVGILVGVRQSSGFRLSSR